jgi:hypothetical protein
MIRRLILLASFLFSITWLNAQELKPGFDENQYMELLSLMDYQNRFFDTANERLNITEKYKLIYSSPEVGFHNQWDLYQMGESVAVIAIRGTIPLLDSWLANFYAAMIPAEGSLQLNDSTKFEYKLAADKRATVHVGWTVSLGYIGPMILEKVKQLYSQGIHSFIICGHSQGGALSTLVRSYLEYAPGLAHDIQFKTYSSAAPKTGNAYYSYDYDFITRGSWSFRIVNAADWVPETPFSIQQIKDLNEINPFMDVKKSLKKQPWLVRVFLKSKYHGLERSTRKAAKKYKKTLGPVLYKRVKKVMPQFKEPEYSTSMQFMPAGIPIILATDSLYLQKFPFDGKNIFIHHALGPYIYLLQQHYGTK